MRTGGHGSVWRSVGKVPAPVDDVSMSPFTLNKPSDFQRSLRMSPPLQFHTVEDYVRLADESVTRSSPVVLRADHTPRTGRDVMASPVSRAPGQAKFKPQLKVMKTGLSAATLDTLDGRSTLGVDMALHKSSRLTQPGHTRIQNSLTFPSSQTTSDTAMAALLADWLVNMGDAASGYMSVALFCQVKLAEIESMAGETYKPNRVRTAVAFALFDIFIGKLTSYSPVLFPTFIEALRSVYTEASLQEHKFDLTSYAYPTNPWSTQELIEKLLGAKTYFGLASELSDKIEMMKAEQEVAVREAQVATKAECMAAEKSKRAARDAISRVFWGWHYASKLSRQRKMLMDAVPVEVQAGPSTREIFLAWKLLAINTKRAKEKDAHRAALAHAKELEAKLDEESKARQACLLEISALTAQLTALQAEHALALQQVAGLQRMIEQQVETTTNQTSRLHKLEHVLSASARALKAAGLRNLEVLKSCVLEVQHTPDAAALEEMLGSRDLQPDKFIPRAYQYNGDGQDALIGVAAAPPPAPALSKPADGPVASHEPAPWRYSTIPDLLRSPRPEAKATDATATGDDDDAYQEQQLLVERARIEADLADVVPPPELQLDPRSRKQLAQAALRTMPADVLLMRWVNYHLSHAVVQGQPFAKRVHNFSGDLADGEALTVLLAQIAPYVNHRKGLAAMDNFRRCELFIQACQQLIPVASPFASATTIADGDANINAALVARLFMTHPGLTPLPRVINELIARYNSVVNAWAEIVDLLVIMGNVRDDTSHPIRKGLKSPDDILSEHLLPVALRRADGMPPPFPGKSAARSTALGDAEGTPAAPIGAAGGEAADHVDDDEGDDEPEEVDTGKAVEPTSTSLVQPKRAVRRWHPNETLTDLSDDRIAEALAALDRYAALVQAAGENCLVAMRQSRAGFDLLCCLQQHATALVWNVFAGKLLGAPVQIVDEREARELSEYTTLYPLKYKDLLDKYCRSQEHAAQEIAAMEAMLSTHRGVLAKIFQYYSASGDGSSISTMALSDYWAFLKDIRLAAKGFGDKKSARLDLIFTKANQRVGLPDESEHNPDRELIPRQFIECIIRIGVLQFEKVSPPISLSESLRRMLTQYVLPNATQSNTEAFRAELASAPLREVFQNHRLALQRVFQHYASNGDSYVQGVSLKLPDFVKFLRDCQLIDASFTPLAAKHVFAHTQLEEAFADDVSAGGGEDDMVYSEFLEAVAAVSLSKITTPYITLPKRVDKFITEYILPKAKQKFPTKKRGKSVRLDAAGAITGV